MTETTPSSSGMLDGPAQALRILISRRRSKGRQRFLTNGYTIFLLLYERLDASQREIAVAIPKKNNDDEMNNLFRRGIRFISILEFYFNSSNYNSF